MLILDKISRKYVAVVFVTKSADFGQNLREIYGSVVLVTKNTDFGQNLREIFGL